MTTPERWAMFRKYGRLHRTTIRICMRKIVHRYAASFVCNHAISLVGTAGAGRFSLTIRLVTPKAKQSLQSLFQSLAGAQKAAQAASDISEEDDTGPAGAILSDEELQRVAKAYGCKIE